MSETNNNYGSGMTFNGLFFLVLFVLKITGHLSWSWWWIAAPLWVPAVFGLTVLTVVGLIALVAYLRARK